MAAIEVLHRRKCVLPIVDAKCVGDSDASEWESPSPVTGKFIYRIVL